jgi:acetylornithine deacetylase/succinyl-diaminopimelate desuccinylase-like protein
MKVLTLELVRIPSPPGEERAVAQVCAAYLRRIGLAVELDEEYPDSPSVIARLRGLEGGPTLQLDGHTDTIALPGPRPRFEDGYLYGRGAEDMKGALAAMAEAARVIVDSGVRLGGSLLLTAHGRHESGTNETLEALIGKGVHGDAVIVAELGGDNLPIAGMGLAIFELHITREGEILHENHASPDLPHPILAGARALELLQERARDLARHPLPHLGPETIFVGRFQGGDYFNRLPTNCCLAGTRRFGPQHTMEDIHAEFASLADQVQAETGAQVEVQISGVEGFRLPEDERIVRVIRHAHEAVTGQELPLVGTRMAANAPHFIRLAKVPAVYYGISYRTAHSDGERVALADMVRAAKVYIHAIVDYLGIEGASS